MTSEPSIDGLSITFNSGKPSSASVASCTCKTCAPSLEQGRIEHTDAPIPPKLPPKPPDLTLVTKNMDYEHDFSDPLAHDYDQGRTPKFDFLLEVNFLCFDLQLHPNSSNTTINPEEENISAIKLGGTEIKGPWTQIDTDAFVTCTNQLDLLHSYKAFDDLNPCPVQLLPATIRSNMTPKGVGFLCILARNKQGHLMVCTFYTPYLWTTIVDERDLI